MRAKEEIQRFTYVTVVLAAVAFAIMAWKFDDWDVSKTWPRRLWSSVSLPFFFWIYFVNYGWKQTLLSWIAPRPDLSGTWIGHLESNWVPNEPSTQTTVIPIVMSIRQDFFRIVVKSFTERAEGTSVFAQVVTREEAVETILTYVYALRDEFTAGAGRQQGAGVLRVLRTSHHEMNGQYWTNTQTRGRLVFRKVSKRETVSYIIARRAYPGSSWPKFP